MWNYNFKLIYCNLFQDMFSSSDESSATRDSSDRHALRYSTPTSWELFRDKQAAPHPRSLGLGHYPSLQLSAVSVPAPIAFVGRIVNATQDKQSSFSEHLLRWILRSSLYYSKHRKGIWLQNSEKLFSSRVQLILKYSLKLADECILYKDNHIYSLDTLTWREKIARPKGHDLIPYF